jgi:L-lactate utilization protein LutC
MNSLRLTPLALALIASFALTQTALAKVESRLHEDTVVMPGRSISPADEEVISSSASRVLHHIARARDELRKKNGAQAKQELKQAETLLDIIQSGVPTTIVKSRVWTADNTRKYENTEEIPASSVPIYATLDARADFDSVKLRGDHPSEKAGMKPATKSEAKPEAKAETKPATAREAEARDAALYFEELDLPLNATRHFVAAAQTDLARNRLTQADQALRAALDNVDFVSVYLPDPLLAARINLQRAEAHYDAGQPDAARADVSRAITQLAKAEKQADPASQADVKQMLDDAKSLNTRLDQPGLKAELGGLWRRAEAHADRALAYTSVGWAKLRQHTPLRGALIEAKRYVAYADIDANVGGDTHKAMGDLEQAKGWLDKAAAALTKADNEQDAAALKDIRTRVDTLLAGQAKPGKDEMAHLKQQLSEAIARS